MISVCFLIESDTSKKTKRYEKSTSYAVFGFLESRNVVDLAYFFILTSDLTADLTADFTADLTADLAAYIFQNL